MDKITNMQEINVREFHNLLFFEKNVCVRMKESLDIILIEITYKIHLSAV